MQRVPHQIAVLTLVAVFVAISSAPVSVAQSADLSTQPSTQPSIHLDLGSTIQSATVHRQDSPVTITTGGQVHEVLPGQLLTPAQVVAVHQVMNTGTQSIVIGANGAAVSGMLRETF